MIRKTIMTALLASSASLAAAQQPPATVPAPVAVQTVPAAAEPAAPDAARLAAARRLVDEALPQSLLERAIDAGVQHAAAQESRDPEEARRDPHLAERTRITARVVGEEANRILREIDPNLRSLLADFYARRLSLAELEEGARFYASPIGRRFYEGAINVALSPEYDQAMRALTPQMERAMEGADQRYLAATADLPPFPGETRPPAGSTPPPAPPAPPRAAPAVPPLPAADPARLAAGNRMAEAVWPTGLFDQPLNLEPALNAVLAMRVGDFGIPLPPQAQVDPNATLAAIASAFDPHFSRRLPVIARFAAGEMARMGTAIEPDWKRIAAVFYAREFTVAELDAMAGFFSSPAGRRLNLETYRAFEDPALVRGLVQLLPRIAVQIPAVSQRIERATAHLPRPSPPPGADESGEDHDHGEGGEQHDH
ncbi:MAG TPA: DUF2059 domain-containing protein [Allosphingosinicella sp.]|jgi:hypothetical protein